MLSSRSGFGVNVFSVTFCFFPPDCLFSGPTGSTSRTHGGLRIVNGDRDIPAGRERLERIPGTSDEGPITNTGSCAGAINPD